MQLLSGGKAAMTIRFVTGNAHKVAQIAEVLDQPIIQTDVDLPEIQAVDVREVIEQKARAAFQLVGEPVLVEDTSLSFTAWNGLPGALIKWFLITAGNEGMCRMLSAYEDKRAIAETYLGFFDGHEFLVFSGKVAGTIANGPRGSNGFGWDPIFQPDGSDKTFAEMTPEESAPFNMRRLAALELKHYLNQHGD
jgi:non-canonical purine NTP pyrophosphatase (RdgB/HAM1 family)